MENIFCFDKLTLPSEGSFGDFNCFIGENDRGKSLILKVFDMIFNTMDSPAFANIGESGSMIDLKLNAKGENLLNDVRKRSGVIKICLQIDPNEHIFEEAIRNSAINEKYPSLNRSNSILMEYKIQLDDSLAGRFYRERVLVGTYPESTWIDVQDFGGLRDSVQNRINDLITQYYILIPAIRKMSVEEPISLDRIWDIKLDGSGLSNAIFEGRNRPDLGKRELFRKLDRNVAEFTDFTRVSGATVRDGRDVEFDQIPQTFIGDATKQILVSFFNIFDKNPRIVGFEEPESHLHPKRQKKLLEFIKKISERNDIQFFITTHSPFIIDQFNFENIFCFKKISDNYVVEKIKTDSDVAEILDLLGIKPHDILLNDLTVFVEGPSDRNIIEIFAHKMGYDFDLHNINLVDLGGTHGNLEIEHLSKINKNFIVLLNSHEGIPEREKDIVKLRKIFNDSNNSDRLIILKKREIENYLSPRVILEKFHLKTDSVIINDSTNVIELVESLSTKGNQIKWGNKRKTGIELANNMSSNEISSELSEIIRKVVQQAKE